MIPLTPHFPLPTHFFTMIGINVQFNFYPTLTLTQKTNTTKFLKKFATFNITTLPQTPLAHTSLHYKNSNKNTIPNPRNTLLQASDIFPRVTYYTPLSTPYIPPPPPQHLALSHHPIVRHTHHTHLYIQNLTKERQMGCHKMHTHLPLPKLPQYYKH